MIIIKVYLATFHNGESYEDFHEWKSKKIYLKREECEKEILDLGYILNNEMELELIDKEWGYSYYANIEELELID